MQMNNLPNGWMKATLGQVGEVSMCKRIMKHQTNGVSGVPFFKIGTFGGVADAYIDKNLFAEYKTKYSYPKVGEVLLSAAGTIGRLVVFDGNDAYFQDSNIVWVANDEKLVLNKYLYYLYCTIKWRTSEGGIVSRLYNNEIRKTVIVIPPINEQEKIAEILGTWDRAIEELTDLIAEKKELKRGLMQRLLTGTQRLPGFSKPWQESKLEALLNLVSIRNKELKIKTVLSVTNNRGFVLPEEHFARAVASEDLSGYKIIKRGDFAYNPSRLNVGSIDRLDSYDEGVLSPMYVVFKCNEKLYSDYMKHWVTTVEFNTKVRNSAQGSVRETVDFKTLSSIKIFLPTDLEEQKAIADVLSKADSEIDLLNQRLDILKEQKRGLMQKLLTGEIRVKVDME